MPPSVDVLVPKLFRLGAPKAAQLNALKLAVLETYFFNPEPTTACAKMFVLTVLLVLWNKDL